MSTQLSKLANPAVADASLKTDHPPVITAEKQADWSALARGIRAPSRAGWKAAESRVSRRAKRAGTRLAIKETVTGSTMLSSGGIVRRGRRSTALRLRDVENILAAGAFAAAEQRPLNRFTTIHFEAAGISDPVASIGRMMKLAKDWLRTRGAELAYIWVRESGHGKGEHVHILWHVPPHLVRDFAKRERGWRKQLGAKPASGAFKSKPVGLSYRHGAYQIQYGRDYQADLQGVLKYIAKGAEPKAVEAFGLTRVGLGGELWGKRSGTSENIGRKARNQKFADDLGKSGG